MRSAIDAGAGYPRTRPEPQPSRCTSTLLVGKLVSGGRELPCRLRAISDTRLTLEVPGAFALGDFVAVTLKTGAQLAGRICSLGPGTLGVTLEEAVDVARVLLRDASVDRRDEEPHYAVDVPLVLRFDGQIRSGRLRNISQTGARIFVGGVLECGRLIDIDIPGLGRCSAVVRWASGEGHGVRFLDPLSVADLGHWLEARVAGA